MDPRSPDTCPNCGADVPVGARACPECGADEETGWSEEARYENLGIPDDSFDYEEFVKREFDGVKNPEGRHRFWRLTGIILLILFLFPALYFLIVALTSAR